MVNWVNDLLGLDLSKVEQCGTGAVYCQIMDSIFLDVPMSKVRFDVNVEYQYINNFKVLQASFLKHNIDRAIPVERLVKCRFQDNLEFLQWSRRFWDANFPGHEYDPSTRRKGFGSMSSQALPTGGSRKVVNGTNTKPRVTSASGVSHHPVRPPSAQRAAPVASSVKQLKDKITTLEEDNTQLVSAVDILETERNFYYDKLYDIEQVIQKVVDELDNPQGSEPDTPSVEEPQHGVEKLAISDKYDTLVRQIQTILYKTADGFEIPTHEYETEETF